MDELGNAIHEFCDLLETALGVRPGPGLVRAIRFHARRVGRDNVRDFAASLILECLEEQDKGVKIDDTYLQRALGRVQKRIVRQARRELPSSKLPPSAAVARPTGTDWIELVDLFRKHLSARELAVLDDALAGYTNAEIARRNRMEYRTAARVKKKVLESLWEQSKRAGLL